MFKYNLPVLYSKLNWKDRKAVREQYIREQNSVCMFCKQPLEGEPADHVKNKKINWRLFPPGFLKHPVHLQHDHNTDLTEGAVHAYCNAYMWQYQGR